MNMAFKPISDKVIVENAIDSFNNRIEAEKKAADEDIAAREQQLKESEEILIQRGKRSTGLSRFNSFSESVTHALLSECIYNVFSKAMRPELLQESGVTAMMRAMVGDFIKEDASDIIYKMRTKSATLSEMYNLITDTKKKILEADGFDRYDPSTYRIDKRTRDDFFDRLDDMDTQSITDAIRDRVTHAVEDFMLSNSKDHERIMTALQMTKDKLEEVKDQPKEVQESYEQYSKRVISKIRNRKKGVFESMVTAMCESVMKDDQLKEEFTEGAKLNIPKIVDRIETMYTFIETVNTMQLYPVDEEYMQNLIESLRK